MCKVLLFYVLVYHGCGLECVIIACGHGNHGARMCKSLPVATATVPIQ